MLFISLSQMGDWEAVFYHLCQDLQSYLVRWPWSASKVIRRANITANVRFSCFECKPTSPNSWHAHFLCSFLPALKVMGDCSSAQSAASLPGPFYSGPPDIPLSALQPRLMSLLSADRKWPQFFRQHTSQASFFFCQHTGKWLQLLHTAFPVKPPVSSVGAQGSDHSFCAQHSQPSLMSLLSAHRKWPQFLRAAFTVKPHVSPISAQKVTTVPVHCIQSSLPCGSHVTWTHRKWPQFPCAAFSQACDVGLLSKMTSSQSGLQCGFHITSTLEMCICLWWGMS